MNLLAGAPVGGIRIVQSTQVPTKREPGPMAVHRSKGHPLVYWLARQFARIGFIFEPDMLTPYQTWIETPQVLLMGDTLYVHPSHYLALKQKLAGDSPER